MKNNGWKVFGIVMIAIVIALAIVGAVEYFFGIKPALARKAQADWTKPEVAVAAEVVAEIQKPALPAVPEGSMPLLKEDGTPKGYALILYKDAPAKVSRPEGGWTIVTSGASTIDGVEFPGGETVGNVILYLGVNPDGTTPEDLNETLEIEEYVTGHISVTTIWNVADEDPVKAAMTAVAEMFKAPHCGQEGCLTVYLHTAYPGQEMSVIEYTSPPEIK